MQKEFFTRAANVLTATGTKAALRLGELIGSNNEAIALGAAKAVLEIGSKIRDVLDFHGRLADLEKRIKEAEDDRRRHPYQGGVRGDGEEQPRAVPTAPGQSNGESPPS
jgi:hypothetical protein